MAGAADVEQDRVIRKLRTIHSKLLLLLVRFNCIEDSLFHSHTQIYQSFDYGSSG